MDSRRLQILDFYDEDDDVDDIGKDMTLRSPPAQTRVHSLAQPLFSVPIFHPEYLEEPVPFTPHASWYQRRPLGVTSDKQDPLACYESCAEPLAQDPFRS